MAKHRNNSIILVHTRQFIIIFCLIFSCCNYNLQTKKESKEWPQISGIYPHLAYYNLENECGTGAVVPWADRLWVITYGPHKPFGSSDKLYEITPDLEQIIRPESIGGTPANRMVHTESGQLFIGPYAIHGDGKVRVIPYTEMPGRHTGNARHLSDPEGKIYYGTMEEGFYEVDINTLEANTLYMDMNINNEDISLQDSNKESNEALLPGVHGKGLYSGQGVLVYSNNGESGEKALKKFDIEAGVLAEWDGTQWTVIRRNQFVEVTGPGGIYGNRDFKNDPIWVTGWDNKSIIVGVRSPEMWQFYRLPKASHSYDGAHGWNTEWPRIRNIGTDKKPDYLMTMHGLFWHFPHNFTVNMASGIRPRSAYLKVIGDFARWENRIVFGCDDSAKKEFLNTRRQKGNIEGPGQSNSNLWFTSLEKPDNLGPNTATGAVWLDEDVSPGDYSEPFLFAGWAHRSSWIMNESSHPVTYTYEVDQNGLGNWLKLKTILVDSFSSSFVPFTNQESGEWIRVQTNLATKTTLCFNYSDKDTRDKISNEIFNGLAISTQRESVSGLLYGLGNDRRNLGVSTPSGYYELNEKLELSPKEDPEMDRFIQEKFAIPQNVVNVESSSVLVIDDRERHWRLPLGTTAFTQLTDDGQLRICREVATERDLMNCHGTFYELPAENADGFAKIRPIASHNFRIHDYASYRGMLVMTGIDPNAESYDHVIRSKDGLAAVWIGVIDDLWKLGKPIGRGGPWNQTKVKSGVYSDPYLIGFYDQKSLLISHDASNDVKFTIEVDPIGHSPWMTYQEVLVKSGETYQHVFPESFQARWIRFRVDMDCVATTWLEYE